MTESVVTVELAQETSAALLEAQAFKITTPAAYVESAGKLQGIKALLKKIDGIFDPNIKRAFDAHRGLVAEKKAQQQPLLHAEDAIKRAVLTYQIAEERKRREDQAKAEEAARKERERLEAQAAKAEEKGKSEKAAALQDRAAAVVAPILAPTTPKIAGLSTRVTYRAEVTDLLELVKAVAAGTVPLNALQANTAFLNNQARAMKETLTYPGVKAIAETGIASRSA